MKFFVWKNLYLFRRFFYFTFNENSLCTAVLTVRRSNFSPCMRMISNHDFYFIVVDRLLSFWTAEYRSYQNHHQSISKKIVTPSESKKNQNTIEKNEFYEWRIWRTIMNTMNENSFTCIKINSWLQYDRASPALLSITIDFHSWPPPWSDLIKRGSASTPFYHQSYTDQHFSSRLLGRISPAPIPIIDPYRPNLDLFSWNNPPKTTLYGDFW